TVEKRLGITIDQISQPGGWGSHTEWLQALRNSVLTRSGDYDAAAIYASQGSALATEGMYYNVKNVEHLNLEKPWWNQSLLEDLEIFDTLYFLGGDLAITQTSRSGLIVYNKNLFDEYYTGLNIYELVDNKEWTIDKLYELSSEVSIDSNNSGITDDGDTIGFTDFAGDGWLDIWIAALGVDITVKEDGYPVLAVYSERTIDAFEKLKRLNYSNPGAIPFDTPRQNTSFDKENVLFASTYLEACEGFRNMQAKYGALPMPLYDSEQDDYATYPQNGCSLIAVLSSCEQTDLIGATLELMAAESYRQVTPEYYQVCLKGKYSADADDARMYDKIVSGIKLDFGFIYGTQSIGGANQIFRKLSGDIAQTYAANKTKYEESLDALIDKLDDLSWEMMG
ncbi:MAG: hypothetical protein IJW79_10055, partial [Clostridia bacterium]|nr:hypothetical protein [Clostridia bacterium]